MAEFTESTDVTGVKASFHSNDVRQLNNYTIGSWIFPSEYFNNDQIPRQVWYRLDDVKISQRISQSASGTGFIRGCSTHIIQNALDKNTYSYCTVSATIKYKDLGAYEATNIKVMIHSEI